MTNHQTNSIQHTGFTRREILMAVGVIALIAAISLSVLMKNGELSGRNGFASQRLPFRVGSDETGRQNLCASNLRQLSVAIFAYAQDHDECYPVSPQTDLLTGRPGISCVGWAGKIYPYVKNTAVFRCPDDPTRPDPSSSCVPVSYAMNSNLAAARMRTHLNAPARTILMFEVTSDAANVVLPDEGIESQAAQQVSAAGDGVNGALINQTGLGSEPPPSALYAMGNLDNSGKVPPESFDSYQLPVGRHSNGSNVLAADGHIAWERGTKISAGENARASPDPQSPDACKFEGEYFGKRKGFPCAEGTAHGAHALTFSAL